MELVDQII